jgi:hypothetical protein
MLQQCYSSATVQKIQNFVGAPAPSAPPLPTTLPIEVRSIEPVFFLMRKALLLPPSRQNQG